MSKMSYEQQERVLRVFAKIAKQYRDKSINEFGVLVTAQILADVVEEVMDDWEAVLL